jgi:para-aminobenzoate synthetase component 1
MHPAPLPIPAALRPEDLAAGLHGEPGCVLLRSALHSGVHARYSFLAVRPFLTFRSYGTRCELRRGRHRQTQFGDPWRLLDALLSRYETLDELDVPFPLGGCFGFWGYDLSHFVEPGLPRRAGADLELPDCVAGFYDSLVVFDHDLERAWIVATGLEPDGARGAAAVARQQTAWRRRVEDALAHAPNRAQPQPSPPIRSRAIPVSGPGSCRIPISSDRTRDQVLDSILRAQRYIRQGDIYQVNLSQRLCAPLDGSAWDLFLALATRSPAPFAAFLNAGDFQIASSSPELFLRMSGAHACTRPIKGTRPRGEDPTRDAQLAYELQTSAKEAAELVMITDLLRNDLGKVCDYGTVQVPELMRLERFAQVQHLVSTVEGRLRPEVTHFAAFASCFPGGSITGAPKIRAMEIIDELEPVRRGPYTGCLGYLGFNRESQLSILIRSAVCHHGNTYFGAGAGIVADSDPEFEYDEMLAKAQGFRAAVLDLAPRAPTPAIPAPTQAPGMRP